MCDKHITKYLYVCTIKLLSLQSQLTHFLNVMEENRGITKQLQSGLSDLRIRTKPGTYTI
jgi:hypothetical protein